MASEGWDFRFEIEWEGCVASEGWDFRFEIEGEVRLNQLNLTSCTILKNRQDACEAKSKFSCGVGRTARP